MQIVGRKSSEHEADCEPQLSPRTRRGIFHKIKSSFSSHGSNSSPSMSDHALVSPFMSESPSTHNDGLISTLKNRWVKTQTDEYQSKSASGDGFNFAPCALSDRSEELRITVKIMDIDKLNQHRVSVANLVVDNNHAPSYNEDDTEEIGIEFDGDSDCASTTSSHLLDLDNIEHGGGGFLPTY